ncbi:DoxX family protein [Candidatus Parcubacteria bacterium]|nr:DoxX family protein [Candidatus Parcubacteria bacterium]
MKLKIVRGLISASFLFAGISKLLGTDMQMAGFQHWGYPLWFMYAVGAFEVVMAIALWTKYSKWANLLLLAQMVGVFYTHIHSHDPVQVMSLAIVTTLLLITHWFMMKRSLPTMQPMQSAI